MSTIAEIVAEELRAAEARIAERIAALLGGGVVKPAPARAVAAPTVQRFVGRVKERLSSEDIAEARRRVLAAVREGKSSAGDIQAATGLERHRCTQALNALRAEGKVKRRGALRRAKYSPA